MTTAGTRVRPALLVLTGGLAALLAACSAPTSREAEPPAPMSTAATAATVILVRHAEKQVGAGADPGDPALTAEGQARADALAGWLADAPLVAVYSTPYRRTTQTAGPAAASHRLQVTPYDPRRPADDFAAEVRTAHPAGTVLVVGHSNTVPALAAAFCQCEVSPMSEAEYDHRYVVRFAADGRPSLADEPY